MIKFWMSAGCLYLLVGCAGSSGDNYEAVITEYSGPTAHYTDIQKVEASISDIEPTPSLEQNPHNSEKLLEEVFQKLSDQDNEVCKALLQGGRHCLLLHYSIKDTPTVNAYPWGANSINFNREILKYIDNKDEMAFLVSREVAHHFAGHLDRQAKDAAETNTAGQYAGSLLFRTLFLGLAQGVIHANNQDYSEGANNARNKILAEMGNTSFSDKEEQEADYIGTYLMVNAGYDVIKGRKFLEKMAALNPENGSSERIKAGYFDTHEYGHVRLARIEVTLQEIAKKKAMKEPIVPTGKVIKTSDYE